VNGQLDKALLEKMDNEDVNRIKEIDSKNLDNTSSISSFFNSKVVRKDLASGSQVYVGGFNESILPNALAFSDHTFVELCPTCRCVQTPSLLHFGVIAPIS
jgi:hypothetical protein